jgi:fluoroacetyl-CoA thioesterase
MKEELKTGLKFQFEFNISETKTVPFLYPESEEFQLMPKVLATGFMIGLIEWGCIKFMNKFIDWPNEQTVGIDVKLSHSAATPPGLTVTVKGELVKIEGRKLTFSIVATDGVDVISEGKHERFIINAEKFKAKVNDKAMRNK